MKKSYVLYSDRHNTIMKLSDEKAGKLLKKISSYHQENYENSEKDEIVDLIFSMFEASFKRNDERYENIKKTRSELGKLGGLAKARFAKQKLAKPSKSQKVLANLAVSVSDSVSVNVSDSDKKNVSELTTLISEFEQMRKNQKKTMTETGKKMFLDKLETLSRGNEETKKLIIKQSLYFNWQSIYPLKDDFKKQVKKMTADQKAELDEKEFYDLINKNENLNTTT